MTDISVSGITKAFEEDNNILDGLSFEITQGEHVGLIGKNGAGKTTLFRLLSQELEPDEGSIVIPAGKRVGVVSQIPKYPPEFTAEDVLKSAHKPIYELKEQLESLERRLETDSSKELLEQYDKVLSEFVRLDGYELDRLRNTVANGLQIPSRQREQLFSSLSGGEKTRINLARLILEDTDILLLDEPTNHLDMKAAEWLEEYLNKFKGTVLTISHDRYFLDKVVSRIIEIVDGRAEFYSGNYSFFVVEKERRYFEQLKKYEKEQAEIKRLQAAADRLYQWGTGNKKLMQKSFAIQSRIERMEKTERPAAERKISVKFEEKAFRGDEVLVMRGVTKRFEERVLFQDIDLAIANGERIALVGDNGTGKSTLIKIIMREERPDSGLVKCGPSIKTAYLPQVITFQNPERSVLDTMVYDENCTPQTARNRLGAFKFSGEDVFKPVSQLSGGEQSRLRLCILMKDDINFLIMDEPTNHLDIASREWIEEAVEAYQETLLFVSHDRYFINRFATRIWELEDGIIHDFKGTFEQYRAYKTANQRMAPEIKTEKKQPAKPKKKSVKSPAKFMEKLEKEIVKLEDALAEMEKQAEEFSTDYEKLMEISERKEALTSELDEKYLEWEQCAEQMKIGEIE